MDTNTVKKVAKLSRLELTDEEINKLTGELTGILKWVEQLAQVNTDNISEVDDENALRYRKDEVNDGNVVEKVLRNAPKSEFDCFVVPKVIE